MKFSAHVTCGSGSILPRQQCNTLCASGFVDDVIVGRMAPDVGNIDVGAVLKQLLTRTHQEIR